MRLSMGINYVGNFKETAKQVVELEKVGLDIVWVAEAYSFDAISQMGYLAGVTGLLAHGRPRGDDVRRSRLCERRARDLRVGGVGSSGGRGLPRRAVPQADDPHQGVHRGLPEGLEAGGPGLRR